jgi:hypothetical protein
LNAVIGVDVAMRQMRLEVIGGVFVHRYDMVSGCAGALRAIVVQFNKMGMRTGDSDGRQDYAQREYEDGTGSHGGNSCTLSRALPFEPSGRR